MRELRFVPLVNVCFGGLVVALIALILYTATLSRDYTGDSIQFAMAIESGSLQALLEPHQMLIHPMGWVFYRLWRLVGWSGGALVPLQVLNAIGGAIAVGLLYRIGRQLAGSGRKALLISAGFALSFGIWLFSTDAEFAIVGLAVSLCPLCLLLGTRPEDSNDLRRTLLLGLATSLSILTYQTNVFLMPVVVAGYLLQETRDWRVRLRALSLFVGIVMLVVGPAYLLDLGLVFDVRDWQNLAGWRFLGGTGQFYGQVTWKNVPHGAYAFLRSLFCFPGLGANDSTDSYLAQASWVERVLFGVYYAVVMVVGVSPVLFAIVERRRLLSAKRRELTMIVVWAVLCAAFAVYWVPGDMQFWLPVLASWWLLLALAVGSTAERAEIAEGKQNNSTPSARSVVKNLCRRPVALILCLAVLLFAVNGFGVVFPNRDPARNWEYQVAVSVAERTAPGDLVLIGGGNRLPLYVPYFAQRRALSAADLLQGGHGEMARAWLEEAIAQTRAEGGRVFLVAAGPGDGPELGVEAGLDAIPAWEVAGVQVLEVLP